MLSNFSLGLKSQRSNEESHYKGAPSEKSEKIVRKVHQNSINLWERAEIKELKFKVEMEAPENYENNQF